MAINYDEDATEDDGSVFEPCGDGTIWDETLNKCIVNPSDTDFGLCRHQRFLGALVPTEVDAVLSQFGLAVIRWSIKAMTTRRADW